MRLQDGAVVSHYLVPRNPALDMPVVTWASARVEQALVGEVDSALLMALAQERSDLGR